MGPKQFHQYFAGRDQYDKKGGKCASNIDDISGRIGIDVAGLHHRKMGTIRGAAPIDMIPEVPLFEASNAVLKDLRSLADRGKREVTIFLDGRPHPMKAGEEESRAAKRNDSPKEIREIYSSMRLDLHDRVKYLRTKAVERTEDFNVQLKNECKKIGIRVVQAPFEADW